MASNIAGQRDQDHTRSLDPRRTKHKARLRLEVELARISHKALAIGLGTSEPQLTRYLGESYPDSLHAHEIPDLVHELGPGYLHWLALQCGGTYHHGECQVFPHQPMAVLIGLLAKQSGATVQQLVHDLSDQSWTAAERLENLPGLRKLQAIVGDLISQAEGGIQ